MGPSVEIEQQANPSNPVTLQIPANTFVWENFTIVETAAFNEIEFYLVVPPKSNANVKMVKKHI